ncbi:MULTISPECIES: ferredoxin [unclassified Streptomyces]|uniref:ferredoxin n=1 Tax=unclassified Streptomyces TaxID=2593676 RepID=UPI002D21EBD3|nr:ferredoxin [Streptomyces sp. HmicA12]
MSPRIAPLPAADWPPALRELLDASRQDGSGRENLFGTLAHHPALAEAWLRLAHVLTHQGLLEPHLRELALLRTSHRLRSPYVRARHEGHACDLGVSPAAVAATAAEDLGAYDWSPREEAVLHAADLLAVGTALPEPLWHELSGMFSAAQLLELLVLVGQCAMVCTTLNTLHTPHTPGGEPLVRVDQARCCSAGQCVSTAPDVFAHDEDGLVTLVEGGAAEDRPALTDRLRLAAALCPSGAIQLTAPSRTTEGVPLS